MVGRRFENLPFPPRVRLQHLPCFSAQPHPRAGRLALAVAGNHNTLRCACCYVRPARVIAYHLRAPSFDIFISHRREFRCFGPFVLVYFRGSRLGTGRRTVGASFYCVLHAAITLDHVAMTVYVRFPQLRAAALPPLDAVVRLASPFDLGTTAVWHAVAVHTRCRVFSRCGRVPLSSFMRCLHAVAVRRGRRAVAVPCVCTPLPSFGDFCRVPTCPFLRLPLSLMPRGIYVPPSRSCRISIRRAVAVVRVGLTFILVPLFFIFAVAFQARCRVSSRCGRVPPYTPLSCVFS